MLTKGDIEFNPGMGLAAYVEAVVEHAAQSHIGVGIHGFFVTDEPAKKGYGLKNILPTRHGYVKGDSKDLTVVDKVIDITSVCDKYPNAASVVTGLIEGACQVLELAIDSGVSSVFIGMSRVNLAAQLQTGCAKIKARDFKDTHGQALPYADALRRYLRAFDLLTEGKVTIVVKHVEITDNGYLLAKSMADTAQRNGVSLVKGYAAEKNQISIVDANGYWNHDHGRHPLLCHPRLIYLSNGTFGKLEDYLYTMDYQKSNDVKKDKHKLEIEVGQLLADCRYAVVKPSEVDPLINQVAKKHSLFHRATHAHLAVIYLSAIFSKKGHANLTRFGVDVLSNTSFLTELKDGSGLMYTHDMPIPRRSRRAALVFSQMEETLKQFEATVTEAKSFQFNSVLGIVTATEITDRLSTFTENTKGKRAYKPHPDVELPNVTMMVDAAYDDSNNPGQSLPVKIKLSIGYDMPTRNTVAALLNETFRAFVLVYRDTELTLRHMTVTMGDKGVAIWATPFAARTFILPS